MMLRYLPSSGKTSSEIQGGSNMTETNCDLFNHKSSGHILTTLYLLCAKTMKFSEHLVQYCLVIINLFWREIISASDLQISLNCNTNFLLHAV